MATGKLATTFTTLDLTGFDIDRDKKPNGITREMIDKTCAVLAANRVRITTRTVMLGNKEIFGICGSTDVVCKHLKEWKSENLALIKESAKGQTDLVTALLSAIDESGVDESDVPQEVYDIFRQIGTAVFTLAYEKADTIISGDRISTLTQENEMLRGQLTNFPRMEMELTFYREQYEKKDAELKEAHMSLSKQKLAESEEISARLESLTQERNELKLSLATAQSKIAEYAQSDGTIARLNGELNQQTETIDRLTKELTSVNAVVGAKQGIETELVNTKKLLEEANQSIVKLQQNQRTNTYLEVDTDGSDVDTDELLANNQKLAAEVLALKARLAEFSPDSASDFLVPESVNSDLEPADSLSVSESDLADFDSRLDDSELDTSGYQLDSDDDDDDDDESEAQSKPVVVPGRKSRAKK